MKTLTTIVAACGIALASFTFGASQEKVEKPMRLGAFSVSLAVKDIKASKAFYEKLDFKAVGGKLEQNWLVMQNDTTTIGLFQGMFESNVLTFNPGWDNNKKVLKEFADVRVIQEVLRKRGITFTMEADIETKGPAFCMLADPDGNVIYLDQHTK